MMDDKKNKILFLTHNYIRHKGDFAGVFLHLLARKLIEKDFEIHVVAPHDSELLEYEEIEGVKIHRFRYAPDDKETFAYRGNMHRQILSSPFKIFTLRKFLKESTGLAQKVIREEAIKIVSTHWLVPNGIVAKRLKKKFKDEIKLVLSSHGTDIRLLTGLPFVYAFLKPVIRKASAWTVVSSYLKDLIVRKDKTIADKIEIMPLPNDESVFYQDKSVPTEKNLIVAPSRLTPQKRLKFLVKAVADLRKEIPSIKLEIYGTGPERENLEKMISELKISAWVKIFDPVSQEELRTVYNRASLAVLNSVGEGFGLTLTEAMLCRTAVIGTKSGGIVDIIDHERTGLLVDPNSSTDLAFALRWILKDDNLREKLAEAGYQKAKDKFSSEATASRYTELFKNK